MSSNRRRVTLIAVLVLTQASLVGTQQRSTPAPSSLDVPTFAGMIGDGLVVSFSWWAVRNVVTYELLRAPAPQVKVVKVASLRGTTLGYQDVQAAEPMYYQLVAVLTDGTRAAGSWVLYQAPTIQSAGVDGADVVVTWSAVPKPPGGYEVWRTALFTSIRVGAVSGDTLSYRDTKASADSYYYQVVAVGAGGRRAASPWVPFRGTHGQGNIAAELAQQLANCGITLSTTELSALVNEMAHGGQTSVGLAQFITLTLSEAQDLSTQGTISQNPIQSDPGGSTASGDPVQPPNKGNSGVIRTKIQLSPKVIDELITKLSTGSNSKLQISQILVAKLSQLKKQ